MDTDTTRLVYASIMAIGVFVWLWSLIKALRLGKATGLADRVSFDEDSEFDTETGEVAVHGEPESLSKALVRTLRQPGVGIFGALFKVTERTANRVSLKKTGPIICNQPTGLYFTEAELNFEPTGKGVVRVSYCLGYARLVRLLRKVALSIILGIGLPLTVIIGSLIWLFVVQSDDPKVRWQVFQTIQIGHALWPPFLFMWFYSVGRRQSKNFVENLIASVDEEDSVAVDDQ